VIAPTVVTVGLSTELTMYPFGITARTLMTSCSILSRDAGLLLYATATEIVKLTFALILLLLIVSNSKYGLSGTTTTAGGITVSGTNA
jgi:hypothetical protein